MDKIIKNTRGLELVTSRSKITKQVQKNFFISVYYLTKFEDLI